MLTLYNFQLRLEWSLNVLSFSMSSHALLLAASGLSPTCLNGIPHPMAIHHVLIFIMSYHLSPSIPQKDQ